MDRQIFLFQFGDQRDSDVKLIITFSDGLEYSGSPVYLHSPVLKKSKFFAARLSERWSPDMSSFTEIKLTVSPNAAAENYIKCINLMYSSYPQSDISFSGVDETLDILPVASELLFEEGIQACMQYLEAVCWTPQQKPRIRALLSSLQVNISTDLAERLEMSELFFREEVELLKKRVPEMLFEITNEPSVECGLPLQYMKDTVQKYIVASFKGNIDPAIQNIFRVALLNECRMKIEGFKCGASTQMRDSACVALLWLLDMIRLCKKDVFEAAFRMFVEDENVAAILVKPQIMWSSYTSFSMPYSSLDSLDDSERLYSRHVLEILVDRFLNALANGDIITLKSVRVSFLKMWVPVIAYLICWHSYLFREKKLRSRSLQYLKKFEEGVIKVLASIPPNDQKQIFKSCADASEKFKTWEKQIFQWWIKVICLAVMPANGSPLQIE